MGGATGLSSFFYWLNIAGVSNFFGASTLLTSTLDSYLMIGG
jgi:hypothetical protein